MKKRTKIVKRFKDQSRTQKFLFLSMGLIFVIVVGMFTGTFAGENTNGGGTPVGYPPIAYITVTDSKIATISFQVHIVIIDSEQEINTYEVTLTKVGGTKIVILDLDFTAVGGVPSVDEWITVEFHEGNGYYELWIGATDGGYNYAVDDLTVEYTTTTTVTTSQFNAPSFTWILTLMAFIVVIAIKKRYKQ